MAFLLSSIALALFALCALFSRAILQKARRPQAPYPPGPPTRLVIGNAFDIPSEKPWLKYMSLSKAFNSDIIHLSVMNTHIVILQTIEDITELMGRRSENYSSRPTSPVVKLLGMENLILLLPYGDALKKGRRMLLAGLKKVAIPSYHHVQIEKVTLLLEQLLHDPDEFDSHCKSLATSIIMAVTYGYDIMPGKKRDRYVDLAEFIGEKAGELLMPGKTLVAFFPILRHVPPWVPGASTQKLGAQVREAGAQYRDEPFEYVKRNMAAGTSKDCILKRLIKRREKGDKPFEGEEIMKDAISGLYLAGADSVQIVQMVFMMAMALHPLQQKMAQDEIDKVVGSDRLPTFLDRASLPFVEAIFREVLRWRPVTPLGLVHCTLREDNYKGYCIPKDAIVIPNIWAITRNEALYPDPESFKPERFLKPNGALVDDTVDYVFGFGRRVCLGRHMVDAVGWLMMVSVLATFNISKARDENGNVINIDANAFTSSTTSRPLSFKCSIVPRSHQAESLIRGAAGLAWQNLRVSE